MRIYQNSIEAVREVERDLFEMGIDVHPDTMQDKVVGDNPDYLTKEVRGYGFKISDYRWRAQDEALVVNYVLTGSMTAGPHPKFGSVCAYIEAEFQDRVGGIALNPGNSCGCRQDVWDEFLHDGKFSYTYSERMAPQLDRIVAELDKKPNTRQAIINIHSNICPELGIVSASADLENMGGNARIPCSMYYQFMRRNGKLDLIYTMRSCDFLTHFAVDLMLALRLQSAMGDLLEISPGTFTYFTGSLHAYAKDMTARGIF